MARKFFVGLIEGSHGGITRRGFGVAIEDVGGFMVARWGVYRIGRDALPAFPPVGVVRDWSGETPVFNPTAGIPKTSYGPRDAPSFDNATWFSTVQPPKQKGGM